MALNRKIVQIYFEKFATTTVIRVFNFIRMSASLVEQLFWIAVLLAFTTTTAWNVTRTVQTFLSEPTASQVSYIVNTTDSLRFNDSVICLEVLSNKLVNLYESSGYGVINEIVHNENFVERLKDKLLRIHQIEDERASRLVTDLASLNATDIPDKLLEQYHASEKVNFAIFTPSEVALLGLTTALFSRLIDLETDPRTFFVDWRSEDVRRLHQAYVERRANFSDLFKLVAEMTCVLLQVRVVRSEYDLDTSLYQYTPFNFCKGLSSMRYFGTYGFTETICYPMGKPGDPPLRFQNAFDSVAISIHPEGFYKEFSTSLKYVSVDLEGAFALGEQRFLNGKFNQRQTIAFSLETYSTSADLRRKPCASKETRSGYFEDCIFWCRMEAIIKACDCVPVFREFVPDFGRLPWAAQSCSVTLGNDFKKWSTDEKCGAALTAKYDAQTPNCSRRCPPNCERFLFASTVRKDDTDGTLLTLKSTKFVYQKVDEYLTMDSRGFASALGGNLSLWLGASFLALVHIVVFLVKLPFECCAQKVEKAVPAAAITSGSATEKQLEDMKNELNELRKEQSDVRQRMLLKHGLITELQSDCFVTPL